MSLTEHYKKALEQPDMVYDAKQELAIIRLEALSQRLLIKHKNSLRNFLMKFSVQRIFAPEQQQALTQGVYLWGGVGRGKSWLMNLFYEELPIEQKKRVHFHHFMLDIHEKLSRLNKQKNPLQHIARELAKEFKVLCIDEFIVTNITDAMILSELLHALFKHRVYLVTTSNRVPDDLYLNGLQRERFLAAIELLKTHTEVFHLDNGIDHRTSLLELADVYYFPITDNTRQQISLRMHELAITPVTDNKILNILGREINTVCCSDEIAWFDFETICSAPRAAQDYIELAQQFNTIIISDIPVMDEYSDDKTRRFIYLIDELYDRKVKLITSACAEPERLYKGNMLAFAYNRTSSRLNEMRSHQYLSQSHRPF